MITIITTADDYGLTIGMNQAIHHLFDSGALSRASAMATGEALEAGLRLIAPEHRARLGAHLCLIEEPPVSRPESIPTLVAPDGRLHARWQLLKKMAQGVIAPDHVALELRAQLGRLRDCGLTLGHVDSHAHLHVWPALAPIVSAVCREFGLHTLRVPQESFILSWPALPMGRLPIGLAISGCAWWCRKRYYGIPFSPADHFLGLLHSGHMTPEVAESWLRRLKRRGRDHITVEMMFHPGYPEAMTERVLQSDHGQYAFTAETATLEGLPALIAAVNASESGPRLTLAP